MFRFVSFFFLFLRFIVRVSLCVAFSGYPVLELLWLRLHLLVYFILQKSMGLNLDSLLLLLCLSHVWNVIAEGFLGGLVDTLPTIFPFARCCSMRSAPRWKIINRYNVPTEETANMRDIYIHIYANTKPTDCGVSCARPSRQHPAYTPQPVPPHASRPHPATP